MTEGTNDELDPEIQPPMMREEEAACGIELDSALVVVARQLAARYDSQARFAAGSFVPAGYQWKPTTGDGRMGTIGSGALAYPQLGYALDERIDERHAQTGEVRCIACDQREAVGQSGRRDLFVDCVFRMRNAQAAPRLASSCEKSRILSPKSFSTAANHASS